MIGILKAFLGLSASTFTALYICFLDGEPTKFLVLLAITPTLVALCCCLFVNYVPFIQVEPHTKVRVLGLDCAHANGLCS